MQGKPARSALGRRAAATTLFLFGVLLAHAATQTDIAGPAGSERFGGRVIALPNGNIVVTDPRYDAPGPVANVGAVYLYDGASGALISTMTGTTADDEVGNGGGTVLSNGVAPPLSLKIFSITRLADGSAVLQGSGAFSGVHTVRASADLSPASFAPIGSVTADAGGFWQYPDAGAIGLTKRFYRVTFP